MNKNVAQTIRELHSSGRTRQEIAGILNVELSYVTRSIRRAKLEGESQSQPIEAPSKGSQSSSGFQR